MHRFCLDEEVQGPCIQNESTASRSNAAQDSYVYMQLFAALHLHL